MALISESPSSVRSLVKPALQLGKPICGDSGCLAAEGSGGIQAGRTCQGGGDVGALGLAQPLASIASSIRVSARTIELSSRFMGHLRERGSPALGLGSVGRLVIDSLGPDLHALGIPGSLHAPGAPGIAHFPLVRDKPCDASQQHSADASPETQTQGNTRHGTIPASVPRSVTVMIRLTGLPGSFVLRRTQVRSAPCGRS